MILIFSIILLNVLILIVLMSRIWILINFEVMILIFIIEMINESIIQDTYSYIIWTILIISISAIESSLLLAIISFF